MTVNSSWEKHLQTWLLGILTIVVIGFGATTIDTSKDVAVIKTQVDNIQVGLADKMGDRYTGTDAKAYREFDSLRADNMMIMINHNRALIKELTDRMNGND